MTSISHYADDAALRNTWSDVFRRDWMVHVGVMGSIVAGTFQGWLKDRMAGPLPYALAELFFVGAVVVWFATLAVRHQPIRGPGVVPGVVLALIIVPALYLAHPGTPLTIELAGLRGWSAFPIACLMALTVIRSPGQLRAYVMLVLALCAITAVYGIAQYVEGPESVMGVSELAQIRRGEMLIYGLGGTVEFRAVSTFSLPATFAGVMDFGIFLAAGVIVGARAAWRRGTRVLMALLILLFLGGIVVSGTRAAMVMMLVGLGVVAWYRGVSGRNLLLFAILAIGVYAVVVLTAGRAVARFETVLSEEGLVWSRVYAPLYVGFTSIMDAPFGLGLGRSGVGVPFAIFQSYPAGFFRGADGDIGRVAVEMGVFGLFLLFLTVAIIVPRAALAIRKLFDTENADLALGIGAMVLATGLMFLVGTPISAVPQATIWWFLLGGLFKLEMLRDVEQARTP